MKAFIALLGLLAACGDGAATYSVAGHTLKVRDSGYVTADYFCPGAAQGQLRLNIVDYDPICGGPIAPTAPGGARDPQMEHNELELVFVLSSKSSVEDPKTPYEVSPPDCDVGPAGPGIAYFKHYPSGSETPQVKVAQSGEIFLLSYDPSHQKPATGKFNLNFGGADQIEGEFETYTCN
jgi:hypothetical protein